MELRDYQASAIDAIRSHFRKGHRTVMLYAPTGAGKTEIAMAMLKATQQNYKRSAMVLDRIVLCHQTSERLDKYGIEHGVLQSGHWRYRPAEYIQICSAQTLEARGSFPSVNLLIVDEAHQTRKQTAKMIAERDDIFVIGLSASPFTDGLGKIYGEVINTTTTRQLVDSGCLVPLRVFVAREIDTEGLAKKGGEWGGKDLEERGKKIVGDVVSSWVEKTHSIFGRPEKTIVFSCGVAHSDELVQEFAAAGYNFVSISYRDDQEFKTEIIEEFKKPDSTIHGLIATDILTKGFDVPDVKIGVSARPFSKSFSSHVQQMGRIMRAHESKEFGVWIDHSGNYVGFLDSWEALYSEGVDTLDKTDKDHQRKKRTKKQKEAKLCPRCDAGMLGLLCTACGYEKRPVNKLAAVAGDLEELDESHKATVKADKETKQRWYSELLGMSRAKGYSDGWAAHKYRAKFGVWPRGLRDVTAPVTPEVIGFVTHLNIKAAKGRK